MPVVPDPWKAIPAVIALAVFVGGCRPAMVATPNKPPPPKVTVATPATREVQDYSQYNGYLEAVESVEIRARVDGFLKEITFQEGEEVEKGQPLYKIDDREYSAALKQREADKLKALSDLRKARSEESRARLLLNSRSISKEDFEERAAALGGAEAGLKQTEAMIESAALQLSFTDIASPIVGRINRTMVTKGNLVGQGEATLLTTIVGMDPLYVYFDVPERDLVQYQTSSSEMKQSSP
ncbi:MAG: efflux RND transporter periplasmic adaptor subunit, partial [Planctomycetia bacterium]